LGLGDDFEQRRAGSVEVDAGHVVEKLVQQLAGVLLQMGAREPHASFFLVDKEPHFSSDDDRQLVLADLVALGEVGIEIILAREDGAAVDLSLDGQAETDRVLHGLGVRHRQRARQRDVDRAGLGVRRGAERARGAREHLAVRGELRVRLDADDNFPAPHFGSWRSALRLPTWPTSSRVSFASFPETLALRLRRTIRAYFITAFPSVLAGASRSPADSGARCRAAAPRRSSPQ